MQSISECQCIDYQWQVVSKRDKPFILLNLVTELLSATSPFVSIEIELKLQGRPLQSTPGFIRRSKKF